MAAPERMMLAIENEQLFCWAGFYLTARGLLTESFHLSGHTLL